MNYAIAATGTAAPVATGTPAAALEHRKLTAAAQQFEGMLLQEMLKPMRQHGFCQGDGQDGGDDKDDKDESSGFGDTLTSFGSETLATAIAKGGGLGIAKRVVEQVEAEKGSHIGRSDGTTIQE
jgi:Rod binding domain-containing protein